MNLRQKLQIALHEHDLVTIGRLLDAGLPVREPGRSLWFAAVNEYHWNKDLGAFLLARGLPPTPPEVLLALKHAIPDPLFTAMFNAAPLSWAEHHKELVWTPDYLKARFLRKLRLTPTEQVEALREMAKQNAP